MTRVLVAGSYAPVRGRAAGATLRAVRESLASGDAVEVVSPRPSAAHHVGSLQGLAGAWTLARLARTTRADTLVLSVEPGVPFSVGASARRLRFEAAALRLCFRSFRRVVVLLPGRIDQEPAPARGLWSVADEVVDGNSGADGDGGRPVCGDAEGAADVGATVTVSGPPNWAAGDRAAHVRAGVARWADRAERAAAAWTRAVVGDHAPAVGRPLRRVLGPILRRVRP